MNSTSVGPASPLVMAALSWTAYQTAAARPDLVQPSPVQSAPPRVTPAPVVDSSRARLDTYA